MHQRRHRSSYADADAASTGGGSSNGVKKDHRCHRHHRHHDASEQEQRRPCVKRPLPSHTHVQEPPLLSLVTLWKWILWKEEDEDDPVGARKKHDDDDHNDEKRDNHNNNNEVPMTCIISAIICVGCFVFLAFLLLVFLLLEHYGYVDVGWWGLSPQLPHAQSDSCNTFKVLPSSPLYTVPNSLAHIGDKSDAYARLRKEWDAIYPPDDNPEWSLTKTREMRSPQYDNLQPPFSLPYDVQNCPPEPPLGYPHQYSTVDLLKHWPYSQSLPSNGTTAHLAICVFDYGTEYVKALRYRQAEVPFVVRSDPRVAEAVVRWSDVDYRRKLFSGSGDIDNNNESPVFHRAEQSNTLEFLYWRPPNSTRKQGKESTKHTDKTPTNWTQPTKLIRMTYQEWYKKAMEQQALLDAMTEDDDSLTSPLSIQQQQNYHNTTTPPYYYYRLIGCGETGPTGGCDKISTSEYLFDELPFFQPTPQQLYLKSPKEQRGVHCRFGMPGVVALNHFDSSRNAIVVLGGQRRYILSHPNQCTNLALFPLGHPSARHSQVNWTAVALDPYEKWKDDFPQFAHSLSNEVILQAGDVLYLPTNWFHSIVSLSTNFQCNTRSGRSAHYDGPIDECGFGPSKKASKMQHNV